MTVRRRIHAVMSYKQGDAWTLVFSWTLTVMVLANVAAVILESIWRAHRSAPNRYFRKRIYDPHASPRNCLRSGSRNRTR